MKRISFKSRKRGPKTGGEEKTVEYGALRLPKDLLEELKLYRSVYEDVKAPLDENGFPEPMKVTFEGMLRRWMDNVGRIDKDVRDEYLRRSTALRKRREEDIRLRIEAGVPADLAEGTCYVDPTEGEIWNMRYEVYDDDLLSVPATIGQDGMFWCDFGGLKVPLFEVVRHEGWCLVNEAAVRIEGEDIVRVERKIARHMGIKETVKEEAVRTVPWYVNADGRHFEVKAGRYGKEDFAIDALPGYHYASQSQMLAARFIRVNIPE